jgi:beta-lactamase class A
MTSLPLERMNELCDAEPFHVGWYLKDLRSGASASRHGDVIVPSASTRKVAILMATLRGVHEGRFALDEAVSPDSDLATTSGCFQWFQPGFTVTFQDVLLMMIIVSDNVSTRHVVGRVGLERVQAVCDTLGMAGTAMRQAVPDYSLPRDHGAGVANDTTPVDQGLLLEAIVAGASDEGAANTLGVTPALCELALDIMSKQRLRSRIPSLLPDGAQVANKTGSLGSNLNDVAVIYGGDEPRFVFTYFTDGVPLESADGLPGRAAADLLAGRLTRTAWDALVR